MANFNTFKSKLEFEEFFTKNKPESFIAIIGSGFASLSLVKNLNTKKIIVFEKGERFNDQSLRGLKIENLGNYQLKENSIEESIGGSSNTWSGRLSEMNKGEFCSTNNICINIFNELIKTFYKKSWRFFGFKNFKQIERGKNGYTERILPKQYSPMRISESLKRLNIKLIYKANVINVGEDYYGTFMNVVFNDLFEKKIYFKKVVLANGGINSSLLLKKSYQDGYLKPNKSELISSHYMNHPKIIFERFFSNLPKKSPFFLKKKYDLNFYGYSLSKSIKEESLLKNTYFTFHPIAIGENTIEYECADEIIRNKKKCFKILLDYIKENNFNFFSILKIFYFLGCKLRIFNIRIKNYDLEYFCEMLPNKRNKIYAHQNSIKSEINLSEDDFITLEILHQKLVSEFPLNVRSKYKEINFRDKKFIDSSHHLGGIPLRDEQKKTVINADLKIVDSKNIYVCSSSVFQSSGSSNPTLTIVALGIRLAEHLNNLKK